MDIRFGTSAYHSPYAKTAQFFQPPNPHTASSQVVHGFSILGADTVTFGGGKKSSIGRRAKPGSLTKGPQAQGRTGRGSSAHAGVSPYGPQPPAPSARASRRAAARAAAKQSEQEAQET